MKTKSELFPQINSIIRNGRNVSHGYARGAGLQFRGLRDQIRQDPLYQKAISLIKGRTIVTEDNIMNIFILMKYFMPDIPFGHIAEFGAYKGGTAIFMSYVAKQLYPKMKVYGFDTFEGMPVTDKEIDAHNPGDFADVDINEIRAYSDKLGLDNLELVQGVFEETAPDILNDIHSINLVHIDCDIKSACAFSYNIVKPYMVDGGYYVFDDALASSCLGATEVVEEFVIQRDRLFSEQIFPQFVFRHNL